MDGFNKALNSEGSSFLNVESDDLMAAMKGTSIPADDFGASAGAANDFGGKISEKVENQLSRLIKELMTSTQKWIQNWPWR